MAEPKKIIYTRVRDMTYGKIIEIRLGSKHLDDLTIMKKEFDESNVLLDLMGTVFNIFSSEILEGVVIEPDDK